VVGGAAAPTAATWLAAFPDVVGKVTGGVEAGDQAALEIVWTATNTGPLTMPDGQIPATGKGIEVGAAVWCTFNGDKIVEIRHYLDVMMLVQQLGVAG
jgi:predicted ester cyclase